LLGLLGLQGLFELLGFAQKASKSDNLNDSRDEITHIIQRQTTPHKSNSDLEAGGAAERVDGDEDTAVRAARVFVQIGGVHLQEKECVRVRATVYENE
jgi:hypothetical protein